VVNPAKACLGRVVSSNLDALATLWGTDKAPAHHGYTQFYGRHLRKRRRAIRSVLEIGIGGYDDTSHGGHSLFMWRSYFPRATIYGVDIFDKHLAGDSRIITLRADQSEAESLKRVLRICPEFDLIVDDGSHIPSDVASSFDVLFPALAPNGLYAIEDLAMAYNPAYGGSRPRTSNALALYKELLEDVTLGGPRRVAAVHMYPDLVIIEKGV
jgi:8-demethyl-8-alpha-L-rhamnosyltetracenomycin-C 2'-O-methyltransferase